MGNILRIYQKNSIKKACVQKWGAVVASEEYENGTSPNSEIVTIRNSTLMSIYKIECMISLKVSTYTNNYRNTLHHCRIFKKMPPAVCIPNTIQSFQGGSNTKDLTMNILGLISMKYHPFTLGTHHTLQDTGFNSNRLRSKIYLLRQR